MNPHAAENRTPNGNLIQNVQKKTMQDEKVNFETQEKKMEALVKESKRHAYHSKEEEKKRKTAEWNVQDVIRKLEAANWQNTILKKKMNNVAGKLTKKLDMTVALQKAEASAWANHKEGMILDMKLSRKRERQLESQIARMNKEHQFELEKEKNEIASFYEETEIAHYQSLVEQHCKPLETHSIVDGTRSREWDVDYWKAVVKSMMRATPLVATDLWEYCMTYMEAASNTKRSLQWASPSPKNMKEIR